ncbi:hypothetical protein PIB30_083428 [Stylosanthes scabra]|uniref:Uncharacterized protein n=1 Tax=Stylosanthes scabra TaxID=79078 RepID=A0ABU6YR66_9FABA|nr:hypothetical protein [Stylosanthes scabra]
MYGLILLSLCKQNSIPNFGSPTRSRKSYSFRVEEEEYLKSFEGPPFEESFKTWRNLTHSCHCSSSEDKLGLPSLIENLLPSRQMRKTLKERTLLDRPYSKLRLLQSQHPRPPSTPILMNRVWIFSSQAKQVYSSGGKVPLNRGTSSKDAAAEPEVGNAPPISATLSRVAAKIMSLLGFPLEDLATDDKLKAELISAINTLDNELPILEADLIHEFGDFVSGLYSSDLLALEGQKKELDAIVEGWKLLCRRAVNCSKATVQISQVLDQGRKSEQEAVARVEALEIKLATAKEGLANIWSANEDLSGKLKRYEENKASLATMTFKAETDMGNARASFNAAEKKVESLGQLRTRLKLSLDYFI